MSASSYFVSHNGQVSISNKKEYSANRKQEYLQLFAVYNTNQFSTFIRQCILFLLFSQLVVEESKTNNNKTTFSFHLHLLQSAAFSSHTGMYSLIHFHSCIRMVKSSFPTLSMYKTYDIVLF